MIKQCTNCNEELPKDKQQNKFCSKSCAVSYNNSKRAKKVVLCGNCGKVLDKTIKKYCNQECQIEKQDKDRLETLLSGVNVSFHIRSIKRLLIKHRGHKCECCANTEWLGNPIPLEVHHIDGDAYNNVVDNFSLLCPNCHTFTDNYKSKNKQSSRTYRKKYSK
ncbi:UNVERIFIED_ORG: HNH endonuclease [Xanthomonas phage Xoo-sp15]